MTDKELQKIFNQAQARKKRRGANLELTDLVFIDESPSAIENFLAEAKNNGMKVRPYLPTLLREYAKDRQLDNQNKPSKNRYLKTKIDQVARKTFPQIGKAASLFRQPNARAR